MAKEVTMAAYRDNPMTTDEAAKFAELTTAYWRDYEDNQKYPGPGSYLEDDGPIFAANLQVPEGDDEEKKYLDYWLTWLTDLTRSLPGARWVVKIDGAPLVWDEEAGWSVYSE